ncbi:arylesterase [Phenylobacterium sp. VNQ135]|uniref:arylesterase n=1 Tax=Phenylobacterium sp. VNQ135 TaxID=3400922 RepID=UPI003C0F4277
MADMSNEFTRRSVVVAAGATSVAALAGPALAQRPAQVAILGDSITAGYGLPKSQALPAQLERELTRLGRAVRVIPAGINGDTTAGGLRRVDRVTQAGTDVCVVALGGNDLLLGADPKAVEKNLDGIVGRLKARGVTVVLAGVQAPVILAGAWGRSFNGAFANVARRHGVAFVPDMLAGVALNPQLNQSDGIHPNAAGVAVIARRLAPYVARTLPAR